ncbi:collagenase [Vibrio lentus]|nr:collagenase [Vibrio lentus]
MSVKGLRLFAHKICCKAQSIEACDVLAAKEADFHQVANTGQQPVADDNNERVEVAVFGSKGSYTPITRRSCWKHHR